MRFSSSIVINSHLWQQLQMALLMKTSRKPSKFIVLTWTILQVPYNFFTTTHASAMLNILCHDATTLVSLENGFQCFKYVLQCRVIYLKGIDKKQVKALLRSNVFNDVTAAPFWATFSQLPALKKTPKMVKL